MYVRRQRRPLCPLPGCLGDGLEEPKCRPSYLPSSLVDISCRGVCTMNIMMDGRLVQSSDTADVSGGAVLLQVDTLTWFESTRPAVRGGQLTSDL